MKLFESWRTNNTEEDFSSVTPQEHPVHIPRKTLAETYEDVTESFVSLQQSVEKQAVSSQETPETPETQTQEHVPETPLTLNAGEALAFEKLAKRQEEARKRFSERTSMLSGEYDRLTSVWKQPSSPARVFLSAYALAPLIGLDKVDSTVRATLQKTKHAFERWRLKKYFATQRDFSDILSS